jgi:hypothetical protein
MQLQTCLKVAGALLITGFLAACGGDNGSPASTTPPAAGSFESKFGAEFAKIFDASSTSQPTVPDSSAVPALQPAGQPIAFPS